MACFSLAPGSPPRNIAGYQDTASLLREFVYAPQRHRWQHDGSCQIRWGPQQRSAQAVAYLEGGSATIDQHLPFFAAPATLVRTTRACKRHSALTTKPVTKASVYLNAILVNPTTRPDFLDCLNVPGERTNASRGAAKALIAALAADFGAQTSKTSYLYLFAFPSSEGFFQDRLKFRVCPQQPWLLLPGTKAPPETCFYLERAELATLAQRLQSELLAGADASTRDEPDVGQR